MKFNYKFSNLLGTVYRTGNVLFTKDGNTLICPVGNKLSMYDLANNRSITLPFEARFNYKTLALSPDGNILIAAQSDGELHLISLSFKKIIYRKRLNGHILNIKFSPDGKYFAVAKHRTVFVYSSPDLGRRIYDPFSLKRVLEPSYGNVLCMDWSHDSNWLCFGSKDTSAHVGAVASYENFRSFSICGNTDGVVGSYFLDKSYDVLTVSRNCHVNVWKCSGTENLIPSRKWVQRKKEQCLEPPFKKLYSRHGVIVYRRDFRIFLTKHFKGHHSEEVVTSTSFRKENGMLVVAFVFGIFMLVDMNDSGSLIYSLNVSEKPISSTCINSSGDWIALGVASCGELLVWEWQSETHVLKQQGHFNAMRVVCYSPDCLFVATGGEDAKIKLWSTQTSFCVVTFSEHSAAVTDLAFTQSGKAIISSSLDGTVRAFDTVRYRNFKTLTSPKPTQFSCIGVDSSGELVVAGGQDNHDIFLWSLQTGKLLEILGGHSGPVSSLKFSPKLGSTKLLSTAWDRSVKIWDAINSTTARETVSILSEGMYVDFRPDGEQFAVATMNGQITFFNTSTSRQEGNIEGRNDLGAGRENADKITAKSNLKSKCFTCLSYSSDGKFIIAAGQSKNVCIYSVQDELLVKKFEVTQNRSFDAMDKTIPRRKMAENGINLSTVQYRSGPGRIKVPGSVQGSPSIRNLKPQVRVMSLAFSKTGRSWAACTTEGLLVYSLDDDWLFDPLFLEEDNTPAAVRKKLKNKDFSFALMMASRLNISTVMQEVLESIPLNSIGVVVDSLPMVYVESLVKLLPSLLETTQHLGFYAVWVNTLLMKHGPRLKDRAPHIISDLSHLQKSLTTHHDNLGKVCTHNEHMLNFLLAQAAIKKIAVKDSALKSSHRNEIMNSDDGDEVEDDDE